LLLFSTISVFKYNTSFPKFILNSQYNFILSRNDEYELAIVIDARKWR
jgi:hypothetical protein